MAKSSQAAAFRDPSVKAAFAAYPPVIRAKLMALRQLIFDTAAGTEGVGELNEVLKWGQPSYLTTETRSGSTVRIDRLKSDDPQVALFFHCQTNLVETFREIYPKTMTYAGNRSIVFGIGDRLPEEALRHCLGLALTYHARKRGLAASRSSPSRQRRAKPVWRLAVHRTVGRASRASRHRQ